MPVVDLVWHFQIHYFKPTAPNADSVVVLLLCPNADDADGLPNPALVVLLEAALPNRDEVFAATPNAPPVDPCVRLDPNADVIG